MPSVPQCVFCSHRRSDKPQVKEFAAQLLAKGIDAWVDEWEILPGDDFVRKISDGLGRSDAGLIFFSSATQDGQWVGAEISSGQRGCLRSRRQGDEHSAIRDHVMLIPDGIIRAQGRYFTTFLTLIRFGTSDRPLR